MVDASVLYTGDCGFESHSDYKCGYSLKTNRTRHLVTLNKQNEVLVGVQLTTQIKIKYTGLIFLLREIPYICKMLQR